MASFSKTSRLVANRQNRPVCGSLQGLFAHRRPSGKSHYILRQRGDLKKKTDLPPPRHEF